MWQLSLGNKICFKDGIIHDQTTSAIGISTSLSYLNSPLTTRWDCPFTPSQSQLRPDDVLWSMKYGWKCRKHLQSILMIPRFHTCKFSCSLEFICDSKTNASGTLGGSSVLSHFGSHTNSKYQVAFSALFSALFSDFSACW